MSDLAAALVPRRPQKEYGIVVPEFTIWITCAVAAVPLGILALWYVYNLAWRIFEYIMPFTYRGVTFSELPVHMRELFRRGHDGCQMVIEDEITFLNMRLRKTIVRGSADIVLNLEADMGRDMLAAAKDCVRHCANAGFRCVLRYADHMSKAGGATMVCSVRNDVDGICGLVEYVLVQARGAAGHTYSVRVKGAIFYADMLITGQTTLRDAWKFGRSREKSGRGRQYKWEERVDFYELGKAIGSGVRRLGMFLFRGE